MRVLRIKDWEKHFETGETKRLKRLSWVAVPTKHDGKNFRRLVKTDKGIAIFGIWVLLLQVAAKSPVRGYLADEDGPLSDEDIAVKTGAPQRLIGQAITHLTEAVGWTEYLEVDSMADIEPDTPPGRVRAANGHDHLQDRTGQTGQDITSPDPDPVNRDGLLNGRQSRPRKQNQNSVFLKLTRGMISDPASLRKWFLWQSGTKSKVYDSDPEHWRFCLECAEQSAGKDNPERYFATLFGGKQVDGIDERHKRRAIELAREFPVSNGVVA